MANLTDAKYLNFFFLHILWAWHSVIRHSRLVIRVESFAEDSLVFSTSKRVLEQGSWVKVNIGIAAFCLVGTQSIIAPYKTTFGTERFGFYMQFCFYSALTPPPSIQTYITCPDLNSASSPSLSSLQNSPVKSDRTARRISAWKLHKRKGTSR